MKKDALQVQLDILSDVLNNGVNQEVADRSLAAMRATGFQGYDDQPFDMDELAMVASGGLAMLVDELARTTSLPITEALGHFVDAEVLLAGLAHNPNGSMTVLDGDSEEGKAALQMAEGVAQDQEMEARAKKYEEQNND